MTEVQTQKRLLVVEDDPDIRATMHDTLTDEGYDVTTVSNGREAWELLTTSTFRPCLVLLDWMMPVMSGAEFMEGLDAITPSLDLKIVAVSASRTVPKTIPTLSKPFDLDQLIDTVKQYCPC